MKYLDEFIKYLKIEKNYSDYTVKNYELDIKDFIIFCDDKKIDILNIKYDNVKEYLVTIYNKKYKSTSLSRKISSLRTFYKYLYDKDLVDKNIFKNISLPKKEKRLPKYVTNDDLRAELIKNIKVHCEECKNDLNYESAIVHIHKPTNN